MAKTGKWKDHNELAEWVRTQMHPYFQPEECASAILDLGDRLDAAEAERDRLQAAVDAFRPFVEHAVDDRDIMWGAARQALQDHP